MKKYKLMILAVFLLALQIGAFAVPPASGYDTDREELSFELLSLAGDQSSYAGADLIKANLEAVGFKINHKAEESAVMYGKIEDYGYYNNSQSWDQGLEPTDPTVRPYDMIYMGLSSSIMFPTGIRGLAHSKNDYPGGDNQWGCRNSTLDGHLDYMMNSSMSQIQYHCYEAQTIMNDIMPYVHVLYQEDAYTNRVGMEGMIAHPTGLFSDGNIFSILNFHNTTNLPAGRDGLEWIMRYFKGVNEGNPDGLLYYEATTARTTFVDRLIWETLLTVNPDNEPIPWLAEEWTVSDDGMQYNFTLRDNVCWSNGRAMTPEDVYESFYFIRDNEEESLWGGSLIEFIDNCTLDGDVISFTLDEFDAWGIYTFADLLIFPEEVYETPYNDETFQDLTNMTTKLGSGPYMLDEVEAADSPTYWKFDANPHYWFNGSLTNDGLAEMTYPRMDKFTIRVITDTSATVTALRSGDVDTTRYYWPDLTAACEPFSPAEIEIVTSASIWRKILWINNEVSPLSDDIVRKAIAYAIDYDAIVEGAEGGYGIPCEAQWLPVDVYGTQWNNAAANVYGYNVATAKALLDAAGYIDVDNDGIREIPGYTVEDTKTDDDGSGYPIVEALMLFTGSLLVLTVLRRRN